MATIQVEHWDEEKYGRLTEASMRQRLESLGYRVSRYVYEPGTVFDDHTHAVNKIDGVYSGRFEMGMQGRKVILEAGDCLRVPKDTVHNARVIGDQVVVSFDATER